MVICGKHDTKYYKNTKKRMVDGQRHIFAKRKKNEPILNVTLLFAIWTVLYFYKK